MNRWHQIERWLKQAKINPIFGAEIGSKHGRFSSYLLQAFPELIMVMVDPMEMQQDGNETYTEWNWPKIEAELKANMRPFQGRYIHIRDYSESAAKILPDEYFDFIFIDAQHDFNSVWNDITWWLPKVKIGGLITGHDYCFKFPGVVTAVNEAFGKENIQTGENDTWLVKN